MSKLNLFNDLPLPLAIVGLGVSGNAIRSLLEVAGIPGQSILTFDEKSPSAQFQDGPTLLREGGPKTLVVSPGVPLSSPWILEARKNGLLVTSELHLAYRVITEERVIAITGSIGKSTTTCLLRAALEKFCPDFFVGGNLGTPLAIYARELLLGQRKRAQWIALELSSYQLENFDNLKSEISVLTYLTSNHLERYSNKDEYFLTKWNLNLKTKSHLILNRNGGELWDWVQPYLPGLKTNLLWTDRTNSLISQFSLKDCQLLGSHNLDNIAMAAEVVHLAKWPESAFEGLREFPGLSHRVENLGTVNGVRFINDSKATTMESVRTAVRSTLESVPLERKLHLLLGGKDKNLPWEELSDLNKDPRIIFYFFGQCRDLARQKSGLKGTLWCHMKEACQEAFQKSQSGDSLLLSPGGTSLDEFKNFEDRGNHFREWMKDLLHSKNS